MTDWEYQTAWVGVTDLDETLEDFGKEGWECFNVCKDNPSRSDFASRYTIHLFFKRPVKIRKESGIR